MTDIELINKIAEGLNKEELENFVAGLEELRAKERGE